ncbi:unnamed protein product, partial [Hapterophycus canaliculatus]
TYHNAFRACEGRLYLLGRQELRAVRVQGWSQRVESLVQAGEWLEALAVALDHFEQKILPAENAAAARRFPACLLTAVGAMGAVLPVVAAEVEAVLRRAGRIAAGVGIYGAAAAAAAAARRQQQQLQQQQRRPAPRSEAAEHINDLLTQYLRLAINNAPAAEVVQGVGSPGVGGGGGSRINLAHSHFQMLAGVCAEFCAVTGRLDMLFGQIFQAFRARGQQGVFLDTLEPYVLMGKLRTLSPEVTSAFV